MIMSKLRLFTLLLLLSCNAFAGLSIADFESKSKKQATNAYIKGLSGGLNAINSKLVAEGAVPLFCFPPFLNLTTANYRQIITIGINELGPEITVKPDVDRILLNQLIKLYPCGYN
jgi:hypothetical protein